MVRKPNASREWDEGSGKDRDKEIPLLKYGAEHWASHTQVGNVSSCLNNAMSVETIFDLNKPYFLVWTRYTRPTLIHLGTPGTYPDLTPYTTLLFVDSMI